MTLKEEIEEILHPERELHAPPRAPIVGEKSVSKGTYNFTNVNKEADSKPTIDFSNMPNTYWRWCDRLETKRTWYHARFDKVHRGSVEDLKRDVQERDQELDVVKLMKKQQKPIFREVMNEFKEKLEKLK